MLFLLKEEIMLNKRKIVFAIGLFLLPIGQPIYLGSASIFSSPVLVLWNFDLREGCQIH